MTEETSLSYRQPDLAAALVAAQAEMPKVEPNATNPHFKSKFVSLDHLIAKTRPVLNRHGLAIIQAPTKVDGVPALETMLVHASGQSVSSVMPLLLTKDDMQGMGAAITYARRYAWAAALGIASEEDDDGEAAVGRNGGEKRQDDPRAGRVKPARGWDDWRHRMAELSIAEGDVDEWLRQACAAIGIESLANVSPEERRAVFVRANRVLVTLADEGTGFPGPSRARIGAAFSEAFDGVVVDGPSGVDESVDVVDEGIEWPA